MSGCASIPKETVTLSMTVGKDIEQLHSGYRETIRLSFDQMRQAGLSVIDNVWTPAYLKSFVTSGELIEAAQAEQTERVDYWARIAIRAIDEKRKEFLDPLQEREDELVAAVDAAFDRVINANAAVTANLNSVLKVQVLQDQVREAVGLSDIRDEINNAIVSTSNWAAMATKEIEEAANIVEVRQ
ncbi:MAG: hypothetical protein OXC31_13705 [Spirochaetaceae bacterium]|nr:hypothetical protein [Spirochaetaceae bacterium]